MRKKTGPPKELRIGTRGSLLALAQARGVQARLKRKFPRTVFRLVVVKTRGDEFQGVELFKRKNVGVFTKAIERTLLENRVDVAVHSLKDLPTELPKRLCLAAFPRRLAPGDALVSRGRYTLRTLPRNAVVGTGSPRRKQQLRLVRPDLRLVDIRGNLDSRVAKVVREKKYDAVVVARAGLVRTGKYLKHAVPIPLWEVMPAVGQAALGLEARRNDAAALRMLKTLDDPKTRTAVCAERSFLKKLGGGCRVPVGILSQVRKNRIWIKASVFSTRTEAYVTGEIQGSAADADRWAGLLAGKLLKKGARKLLKEARE